MNELNTVKYDKINFINNNITLITSEIATELLDKINAATTVEEVNLVKIPPPKYFLHELSDEFMYRLDNTIGTTLYIGFYKKDGMTKVIDYIYSGYDGTMTIDTIVRRSLPVEFRKI